MLARDRPVALRSSVSSPIKWGERENPLNSSFQLLNSVVWNIASLLISQQHGFDLLPGMVDGTLCSTGQMDFPGLPPSPLRDPASGSVPLPPAHLLHSLLSLRAGPLAARAAAHSATAPVRASCLTARASTASASRSSSDEDPSPCPWGSGQPPGPTCPLP